MTDKQEFATRRIVTARHGRPALARDRRMGWRDYGEWWAEYERAGLHHDERPPDELKKIASASPVILSSTRPRAIETARMAAGDAADIPAHDLFVEMPLPPPPLPLARLTPGVWGVVSRTYWFLGYAPGAESHAAGWRRIARAREALIAHAAAGDVLLCAHGYFNWMLDVSLRRHGWKRLYDGGSNYWSWRIYEGLAPVASPADMTDDAAPAPASPASLGADGLDKRAAE